MENIAEIFRQYYTSPRRYSTGGGEPDRITALQDYILKSGLLWLSDKDLAILEEPLSAEELALAFTQTRKSP